MAQVDPSMAYTVGLKDREYGSECTQESVVSGEQEFYSDSDSQKEIEDFQSNLEDPFEEREEKENYDEPDAGSWVDFQINLGAQKNLDHPSLPQNKFKEQEHIDPLPCKPELIIPEVVNSEEQNDPSHLALDQMLQKDCKLDECTDQTLLKPDEQISFQEKLSTPSFNRIKSNSERTCENVRSPIFLMNQNSDARKTAKFSPNFKLSDEPDILLGVPFSLDLTNDALEGVGELLGRRGENSYLEVMAQGDSEFDRQLKKLRPGNCSQSYLIFQAGTNKTKYLWKILKLNVTLILSQESSRRWPREALRKIGQEGQRCSFFCLKNLEYTQNLAFKRLWKKLREGTLQMLQN